MSDETFVTVRGYLESAPTTGVTATGVQWVNLRLGSTPRRRNRETGEWVDAETIWKDCVGWRDLAENIEASNLQTGTPVLVHGFLKARSWVSKKSGNKSTIEEIEMLGFGPDLSRTVVEIRPKTTDPQGNDDVPPEL